MVKKEENLIELCAIGVKDETQTITQPMPLDFPCSLSLPRPFFVFYQVPLVSFNYSFVFKLGGNAFN